MEHLLRERFLKVYANIPISLRDDIVLVFEDGGGVKQPLTWSVIYLEVINNSETSKRLLKDLDDLHLI